MRNLRSDSFVTAGIATGIDGEVGYPIGGGVFNAPDGLGRGDSYSADVYTPNPSERQLRETTDTDYEDWMRAYVAIYVAAPGADGDATRRSPACPTASPGRSGASTGAPEAERFGDFEGPAERVLEDGDMARVWELAQRLRRESATPYEYIRRVEALLATGYTLLRAPAARLRDARRLPVRLEDRLLPAVLRRRGAAAADGRHPGAGRDRLHVGLVRRTRARVRRARPRRPLMGRGVVPGLRLGDA